jgi:MinD superfamily P-loop ATPase
MKENKIINSIITKNLNYDKIIIIIQLITLKISDDNKINKLIDDILIRSMNDINKYEENDELKNKYKNNEIDIFNKILNFYNVFVNNIKYKTIGHFIKNIDDNFGIVSDSDCEYFINISKKQPKIIDRSKYLVI